jgi:aminomethyltransferase
MQEKRTPLYDEHVAAGAKMVPFAGYVMPLEYTSIISEHRAVRQNMGMFDLSHMGEFHIHGPRALEAMDTLVTNNIRTLEIGQARYTPMCYPHGGIVDDLVVYRYADHLMLVVNAANIGKDLAWITERLASGASVDNASDEIALIAVQGPNSATFLQQLTAVDLSTVAYYHFCEGKVAGIDVTISRTGYTGEDGFELYVPSADAVPLWRALQTAGETYDLALVGLGARDTLRLEAGFALYGNDITETTTPLEASLGWTVKFDERDFIGRAALEKQKQEGVRRRLVAFAMCDRAIPRAHYPVLIADRQIGEVTSGSYSPTFNKGIGLAYVPADHTQPGTSIQVMVRAQPHPAEIVKKPMYKRPSLR